MLTPQTIAFIPARGGSKRLPRKNLLELDNKPLIAHSIDFALKEKSIDEVWVSTDSKEIADISEAYGANVLKRPAWLAGDNTPTKDVIGYHVQDFINKGKELKWVCVLQPTNPLRPDNLVTKALEIIEQEDRGSLACFSPLPKKFGRIEQNEFIPESYSFGQRSQDITNRYYENGLLYLVKSQLAEKGTIFSKDIYPLVIDTIHGSVDIDTSKDFEFARIVLEYIKRNN